MKIKLPIYSVVFFALVFTNCGHKWTEREKTDLKNKCEATVTMSGNNFFALCGFEGYEIDTILIKEKQNTNTLDSFYVSAKKVERSYYVDVDKEINLLNTYEIIIQGQKKYVLRDMKIKMVPQYTNGGEGYGCDIDEYYLDDILEEGHGIIIMKK